MTVYHLHESFSSSIGDPVEYSQSQPENFDGVRYTAKKRNSYLYRAMLSLITSMKEQLNSAPQDVVYTTLFSTYPEMIVTEHLSETDSPFVVVDKSLAFAPQTPVIDIFYLVGKMYMAETGKVIVGHESASYGSAVMVDPVEYMRRLSVMVVQSPTTTYVGQKLLLTSSAIRRLVTQVSDVKYSFSIVLFRKPMDLEQKFNVHTANNTLNAFYLSDPLFQSTMYDKLIVEATRLVKIDEFETLQKGGAE